ncbi:MAG: DUF3137 domain-containing protein [Abditibacteriaceae bacterium]
MSTDSPLIQPLQLSQFDNIRNIIEEYRRGEFQKILNWFIGGFTVAIVVFIGSILNKSNWDIRGFMLTLFLCLIFPVIITWQIDQAYQKLFTSLLLPEFIKHFNMENDVELQCNSLTGISESTFNSCGLFQQTTDYSSDGLIKGKIGKTTFECASVLAQKVPGDAYGKSHQQTAILFHGLFFIADANKNFNGTTFVIPDYVETLFGHTGHSLQELFVRHRFGHCELVSLEDPTFERDFAVYSSDQIEARYLLTPLIMQRISTVQRSWKHPIHIAFIYDKIFLAIETPQNWFAPPSVFSSVTAEVVQEAHDKILMMLSLVDEMELNTRIWGRT